MEFKKLKTKTKYNEAYLTNIILGVEGGGKTVSKDSDVIKSSSLEKGRKDRLTGIDYLQEKYLTTGKS